MDPCPPGAGVASKVNIVTATDKKDDCAKATLASHRDIFGGWYGVSYSISSSLLAVRFFPDSVLSSKNQNQRHLRYIRTGSCRARKQIPYGGRAASPAIGRRGRWRIGALTARLGEVGALRWRSLTWPWSRRFIYRQSRKAGHYSVGIEADRHDSLQQVDDIPGVADFVTPVVGVVDDAGGFVGFDLVPFRCAECGTRRVARRAVGSNAQLAAGRLTTNHDQARRDGSDA
ncbi:hypothetical protein AHiyo8_49100 [Arthrobacter sp. Hiyo8]|nr:hypothetical protein AHiyo8_49100 [Arthrobacter sp. Hiyo8]